LQKSRDIMITCPRLLLLAHMILTNSFIPITSRFTSQYTRIGLFVSVISVAADEDTLS
jgi:hypothetical protein